MNDIRKTLDAREKTHGSFAEHARITQDLKRAAQRSLNWNKLNDVQAEAIDMTLHKIGRILAGNPNERDHWFDIVGYNQLVVDEIDKKTFDKKLEVAGVCAAMPATVFSADTNTSIYPEGTKVRTCGASNIGANGEDRDI